MLLLGFKKLLSVSLGTSVMDDANLTLCVCVFIYIYVLCMHCTCAHKFITDPLLCQEETNMITAA